MPRLQIAPGWLIYEKTAAGAEKAIRLVTFMKDRQHLFPKAFIDEAKRDNLTIREVLRAAALSIRRQHFIRPYRFPIGAVPPAWMLSRIYQLLHQHWGVNLIKY